MPKLKRTRLRSRIKAKLNSNQVFYNTGDSNYRQLIQEHLVKYLGEAEPPIPYEQEYIDYLDIECGNQPRSRKLAGHDDIGSTEIYAHVDMSDVRKAVEKHPLG